MADLTAWRLAITGDLGAYATLHEEVQKRADSLAMQSVVESAKKQGRALIIRAGLGQRIANAFRGTTDPRKGSPPKLFPSGVLYSKATYKRQAGLTDVITAFREGFVIKGRLYVPAKGYPRDPRKYGGRTVTVKLTHPYALKSGFLVVAKVIDTEHRRTAYTIVTGVRHVATLGNFGRRVFDRADAALEPTRLRAYETEVKRIERKSDITVRLRMQV